MEDIVPDINSENFYLVINEAISPDVGTVIEATGIDKNTPSPMEVPKVDKINDDESLIARTFRVKQYNSFFRL